MSKLTTENRAAILSVRAKARKALAVQNADLPASVQKNLQSVVEWADSQLKVAPVKRGPANEKPLETKASKAKGKAQGRTSKARTSRKAA